MSAGRPQKAAATPKRIDLLRRSAAAGELGLRLVIDGWEPD
jgi:hypothetical protein